jgi:chromate reductase
MSQPLSIVGIPGSLRKDSLGRALLRAIEIALPEEVTFTVLEAGDLPVFDSDVETTWDGRLGEIKAIVAAADGILVCTPEYNGSYSGHVKNSIDWLSRGSNPFKGKPSAAIAVSGGVGGGVQAANHLRAVLMHLGSPNMPTPRLNLPKAADLFDDDLQLVDETAHRHIDRFIPSFLDWVSHFTG